MNWRHDSDERSMTGQDCQDACCKHSVPERRNYLFAHIIFAQHATFTQILKAKDVHSTQSPQPCVLAGKNVAGVAAMASATAELVGDCIGGCG
jgi:hypothetical protein